MKPFVKWAGGKRQILFKIKEYINDAIPKESTQTYRYIEPFVGGGAVLFDLAPKRAIINDLNDDLINAYRVIKSDNYAILIDVLTEYKTLYWEDRDEFYYETRRQDREPGWPTNTDNVHRAARMIFLNKTCYNGLYRVNSRGEFNTPIGRYMNPAICDSLTITEVHNYLSNNDIQITCGSYENAINEAMDGDIVYIDPPYDYQDDDGFTKYQLTGFDFDDFKELKEKCDKAINRGAIIIISNNATEKVKKLFEEDPRYKIGYYPEQFATLRSINSKGLERRTGHEIIILGMPDGIPFPQANDLDKVISLVAANADILNDKEKMLMVLNVTSERQIAYYLSALKYFGYITHKKTFTEKAIALRNSKEAVKRDVAEQLLNNDIFAIVLNDYKITKKISMTLIKRILLEKEKNLSETTVQRRASTVKSWLGWLTTNSDKLNY